MFSPHTHSRMDKRPDLPAREYGRHCSEDEDLRDVEPIDRLTGPLELADDSALNAQWDRADYTPELALLIFDAWGWIEAQEFTGRLPKALQCVRMDVQHAIKVLEDRPKLHRAATRAMAGEWLPPTQRRAAALAIATILTG